MSQYSIDQTLAKKALEANKHNNLTTTYYLLIRKYMIQGRKGIIDPNCSMKHNKTQNVVMDKSEDNKSGKIIKIERAKSKNRTTEGVNKGEVNIKNVKEIKEINKSTNKSGIQINQIIDIFNKKMGFEFEENYYKRRAESGYGKKRNKDMSVPQRRKTAHDNWEVSKGDHKAPNESRYKGNTNDYIDIEKDKTNDLSYDGLRKIIVEKTHNKNELEGTSIAKEKQAEIESAKRKNYQSVNEDKHKAYTSLSPHKKAEDIIKPPDLTNKIHDEYIKEKKTNVETKEESSITIIQRPQINNINNYNNINIQTLAINKDTVQEELLIPHPPSFKEFKTNQFRKRKYRLVNNVA